MISDDTGPYDLGLLFVEEGAKSQDPRLRFLAAMALGAIARADTQETLRGLLKDPDANVRVAAATSLLQLGKSPRRVGA